MAEVHRKQELAQSHSNHTCKQRLLLRVERYLEEGGSEGVGKRRAWEGGLTKTKDV